MSVYPASSASISTALASDYDIMVLPIRHRMMKWANSAANDDWDVYLHGYFVQPRTR